MITVKKYSPPWWAGLKPHEVGNTVEGLVEEVLKDWNNRLQFAWHRIPDTKATRSGILSAQPADYLYRCGEHSGFIEAKGLGHPYRMPKGNLSQLPTLRKWRLAGSNDIILVHHYMEGLWRAVDPLGMDTSASSWDLGQYATYGSARAALLGTGFFKDGGLSQ